MNAERCPGKVCRECGRTVGIVVEDVWDQSLGRMVGRPSPVRFKNPMSQAPSDEFEDRYVEGRNHEGHMEHQRVAVFPYVCNTCGRFLRAEEVMDAPEPQQTLPNPCQTGGEWQGPDAARNAG